MQSQTLDWIVDFQGFQDNWGTGMEMDEDGNFYITGAFDGPTDLAPGPQELWFLTNGSGDFYVVKLDADLNFQWGLSIGSADNDKSADIELDSEGNIYICGTFQSTVDFDAGPEQYYMTAADPHDAFLMKLNPDGYFIWAKTLCTGMAYDLSLDSDNNVYVTGACHQLSDFDPGPGIYMMEPGNFRDIFITKLDTNGDFVWAALIGGEWADSGLSILNDDQGNIIVAGQFQSGDFDPGQGIQYVESGDYSDGFVLKLDPFGNFIWMLQLAGPGHDQCNHLALDNTGNIIATGECSQGAIFLPVNYPVNFEDDDDNVFVAKINSGGTVIWANSNMETYNGVVSVTVDIEGNIYNTGCLSLSDTSFECAFFFEKFDSLGNVIFYYATGQTGDVMSNTVIVDALMNIFIMGTYGVDFHADPSDELFFISPQFGFPSQTFLLKWNQCFTIPVELDTTICNGESVFINGNYYAESGTYYDYLSTADYCDSLVITNLHVVPEMSYTQEPDMICTTDGLIPLTQGDPFGGTYSGTGVENGTFNPAISGPGIFDILYTYTNPDGCTASDTSQMIVVVCPGTEYLSHNPFFQVYPVPAYHLINIESTGIDNLRIADVMGKTVLSKDIFSPLETIDISNLPEGFYQLILRSEYDEMYSTKIVISRSSE